MEKRPRRHLAAARKREGVKRSIVRCFHPKTERLTAGELISRLVEERYSKGDAKRIVAKNRYYYVVCRLCRVEIPREDKPKSKDAKTYICYECSRGPIQVVRNIPRPPPPETDKLLKARVDGVNVLYSLTSVGQMRGPEVYTLSRRELAILKSLAKQPQKSYKIKPETEDGKGVSRWTITTSLKTLVERGYLYPTEWSKNNTYYVTPKTVQLLLILLGPNKTLQVHSECIRYAAVRSGYTDREEDIERFKLLLMVGRACKVFRFLDMCRIVPLGSRITFRGGRSLNVDAEWVVSASLTELEQKIQAIEDDEDSAGRDKTSLARIDEDFMAMFETFTWDKEFQSSHMWAVLWSFMKRWLSLVDQPFTKLGEVGLTSEQVNLLDDELQKAGFFEELQLRELDRPLIANSLRRQDRSGRAPLRRHIPTIRVLG